MHSLSSFWQVLHNINILFTQYLHILHCFQTMKITFVKLFLICMFKDPHLAEKLTIFAENLLKKFNSAEFMEFVFSMSEPWSWCLLFLPGDISFLGGWVRTDKNNHVCKVCNWSKKSKVSQYFLTSFSPGCDLQPS